MKDKREEIFAAEAVPHLKDLCRTAVRLTRENAQAEDIVQEVYLQAWKSFESYESGTNCRAWLYKIMFFKISHHRRATATQSKFFQRGGEENLIFARAVAGTAVSPLLTDEEVIAAIDNLSPDYRAVVLLSDVEEFDYKEIAVILKVPIGTVMLRLSRARKQLRASLAKIAPEYGIKNFPPASVVQISSAAACR